MDKPAFDAFAVDYDREFSFGCIGKLQRARVWRFLDRDLNPTKKLSILEINCGTGIDALYLAKKGHSVLATDISAEMIQVAKHQTHENLRFEVCSFQELSTRFQVAQFDMVFSNFAGLNCVDTKELSSLNNSLSRLLKPGGKFIAVLLGKHCWMERLYFQFKGNSEAAKRRLSRSEALLNEQTTQSVWCYDTDELKEIFDAFQLKRSRPIGLFIPPSYFEKWISTRMILLKSLFGMEILCANSSIGSNYADHIYLSFQKR